MIWYFLSLPIGSGAHLVVGFRVLGGTLGSERRCQGRRVVGVGLEDLVQPMYSR